MKVLASRLADDAVYVKRFVREASAAARLDHPNIVTVYSVGEQDGLYYIAMQHVKGCSLAQLIREQGPVDCRRALGIIRQAAEALAEAHKHGIIHRDIKPDNIMVDEAGRAKVMDFGLARVAQSQTKLSADGAMLGTPAYMSPEQIQGTQLDERTDLYSLGVTLFEMLTGSSPFEADTPMALMYQIAHVPFPNLTDLNPAVPAAVAELVARMTARSPDDRHRSAKTLCTELEALLRGEVVVPGPKAGKPSLFTWRAAYKYPTVAIVAVAVLCALFGVLNVFLGAQPLQITWEQIPWEVGNTWTFEIQSQNPDTNGKKMVYDFFDSLEYDGKTFIRDRMTIPGSPEIAERLQLLTPDGWYGFWDPNYELPSHVTKFPLSAGMVWEQKVLTKDGAGEMTTRLDRWEAEAEETIELPVGALRCIRVRVCWNTKDESDDALVWFAPNMGFVKYTDKNQTLSLVRFEGPGSASSETGPDSPSLDATPGTTARDAY